MKWCTLWGKVQILTIETNFTTFWIREISMCGQLWFAQSNPHKYLSSQKWIPKITSFYHLIRQLGGKIEEIFLRLFLDFGFFPRFLENSPIFNDFHMDVSYHPLHSTFQIRARTHTSRPRPFHSSHLEQCIILYIPDTSTNTHVRTATVSSESFGTMCVLKVVHSFVYTNHTHSQNVTITIVSCTTLHERSLSIGWFY